MSQIDDDIVSNLSANSTLHEIVSARISRRGLIGGGVATAALAATGGIGALLTALPADARIQRAGRPLLGFAGIAPTSADAVVVPPGYTAKVLIAWGDPVSDGPQFRQDASNSALEQEWQWGMHNDGMVYFPIQGSWRGLIVQNHEYTDDVLLFPDGTANWSQEKTNKALAAHGVGIIEVARRPNGDWRVVRPSGYARRITGNTPMLIGGPAAGDPRLRTLADPHGRVVLGTLNNCAMGFTPWGTYLACEENFNGYFRKASGAPVTELERRYGLSTGGFGYNWHLTDARFRVDPGVLIDQPNAPYEPNEPNRFGWVVEIDPFDPNSTPVKRTALGRMKHEGAWCQEARDGRLVVYMGDDEVFEYIYRYVSKRPWRMMRRLGVSPLDQGTLYVAKFNDDGTGQWLPLTPDNPDLAGMSLNDILINTRGASDRAGGTRMDRPEWIDTFPQSLTAIATLTNNSGRGVTGTNPRTGLPNDPVDAVNPRAVNSYGHIVSWSYRHDWTEPTFRWDIFALGGDPEAPGTTSTINGDKYGSPDGIYVAPSNRLWIQTDVSGNVLNGGAYAGFGNNQMLCADPVTRETRRFLVGPRVCEITGVFVTPDERTMFVGIQHPGEAPTGSNDPANPKQYSSWPDGPAGGRPRSALVVITKDDGGQIGS
ncbi:MAG: PhoX family phosphatase [Pseudomonadota bacterium]|nr:PhoX family phosphatase [Pseudomonadota bacterium]